jgi:hypothetical protein
VNSATAAASVTFTTQGLGYAPQAVEQCFPCAPLASASVSGTSFTLDLPPEVTGIYKLVPSAGADAGEIAPDAALVLPDAGPMLDAGPVPDAGSVSADAALDAAVASDASTADASSLRQDAAGLAADAAPRATDTVSGACGCGFPGAGLDAWLLLGLALGALAVQRRFPSRTGRRMSSPRGGPRLCQNLTFPAVSRHRYMYLYRRRSRGRAANVSASAGIVPRAVIGRSGARVGLGAAQGRRPADALTLAAPPSGRMSAAKIPPLRGA